MIGYLIERSELTQKQLAEKVGVKPSTISMWKTGDRTPRFDKIPLLAEALHCTVDELFGLESAPAKKKKGA